MTTDLIPVFTADIGNSSVNAVDARKLHTFLEIGKDFTTWIKDRIQQYGFQEKQDFEVFTDFGENPQGGRPSKEYHLSLDMAKELAMVERNEKGKQARQYFIECERRLLEGQVKTPSLRLAAFDALKIAKEGARVARSFGFNSNMIALSADCFAKRLTGISVLEYMGATHLIADEKGRTYTPTELGKLCNPPLTAIKFNLLLESAGLQVKEFGNWLPTDASSGLFEWLDTGKRHSDGAPVKQIKWFKAVLDRLFPQQQEAA